MSTNKHLSDARKAKETIQSRIGDKGIVRVSIVNSSFCVTIQPYDSQSITPDSIPSEYAHLTHFLPPLKRSQKI